MSPANLTEADAVVEELEIDEPTSLIPEVPAPMPPVVLPSRPPAAEHPEEDHHRGRVLDHLIGMAEMYARGGALRQAIELYFEVLGDHGGTPQAGEAEDRLLAIAQHYEDQREFRLARGIYERLLKAS
ncbi:MAG: hypothetical protein U0790_19255 [Isosphaeraceae bacterium]